MVVDTFAGNSNLPLLYQSTFGCTQYSEKAEEMWNYSKLYMNTTKFKWMMFASAKKYKQQNVYAK